ncbi:hypothetical protein ZIOFF_028946 [Zingiber officinale]|uniref:GRAM domain-containing protein n=1 Tax=Zingiber officinale TaxID=94328 RepID=A0A8J5GVV8_ZINOF|nr:hypothetical protein ZIOFF_028946 [Zingiber officinale]
MSQGRPTAAPQEAAPGTWVMGTPVPPYAPPPAGWSVADYGFPASASSNRAGNPYLDSSAAPIGGQAGGNPYVNVSPVPNKNPTETILKVLGRCGKKFEDTSRKAAGAAGHVWQHRMFLNPSIIKTSPSFTDAALARITQGTKVLAEGGNDKVFQQIFNTYPGEQLWKSYACYVSTSVGPVIGTLYLSTARIAFCSDNPVSHSTATSGQQEMTNYKVVVPLDHLRAVNPSANTRDPSDKYIQIITTDNHEFWFMGFISYDKAFKNLKEALQFSPRSSYF